MCIMLNKIHFKVIKSMNKNLSKLFCIYIIKNIIKDVVKGKAPDPNGIDTNSSKPSSISLAMIIFF